MLKKMISLLLVFCTLTSTVCIAPVALEEYEYSDTQNGVAITDWNENASYTVVIPDNIDGKTVTEIRKEAFSNCASIYEIVIPDTVTLIDPSAFIGCTSLKAITVSDSNEAYKTVNGNLYSKDGKTLVKFCDVSAAEFSLPDTVSEISPYAFYQMDKLTSLTLNNVKSIGKYAFYGCSSLKNIDLSSVEKVEEYAFYSCISLTYANIGIKNIPEGLFYGCEKLEDVVLTGTESVGKLAFAGCFSLKTVLIPNGASVAPEAFFGTSAVLYGDDSVKTYALENENEYKKAVYTGSIQVSSVAFASQSVNMRVDDVLSPSVSVLPNDAEVKDVIYTSSNEDVVKIVDGRFSAVGKGVATVVAKSVNGAKKAVITVNVSDRDAPLQSSHPYESGLNQKYTYTLEGEPEKIAVAFSHDTYVEEYEDFIIVMDKNNENVGTYTADQLAGKVLIIDGDTVNIMLISDDDVEYFGFCITHVMPAEKFLTASEITLDKDTLELNYGDTYKLNYTLSPNGALISDVYFVSSDNDVVSVDPDGTVYAMNKGQAHVIAYDKVSGKSAQCLITVNKNVIDGMHYTSDGEKISITYYEGEEETLTIPSKIDDLPVEVIADGAFMYSPTLKSVTVPSTVTVIANDAFVGCVNLTEINVSEENEKFSSSDGVLYSKDGTYLVACPGGKTGGFIVKDGVVAIGAHAFNMCVNITDITLSLTVELIAQTAFDYCEKLTAFAVESSDHFAVNDGVLYTKDMKALVHYPCAKEGKYVMPQSVEVIKDGAFNSAVKLTDITISKNLSEIEKGALSHAENLKTVTCGEDNMFFASSNGILYDKDKKTVVCCPPAYSGEFFIKDGVETIGEYAFAACVNVTDVFIPSTVKKIGKYAFFGADGISRIILPPSVVSVGEGAFDNCSNVRVFAPDGVVNMGTANGSAVILCSEGSQTWENAQSAGYKTEAVTYSSTQSGIAIYYGVVPKDAEFEAVKCKNGKTALLQMLFPSDEIRALDISFGKYITPNDYTAVLYTDEAVEAVYRVENGNIEEIDFTTVTNGISFLTRGGTYVLSCGVRINDNTDVAIRRLPDKTEYSYGEEFVKNGLEVYYKNFAGIVTVLDSDAYTMDAPTLNIGGEHTVKVTYDTKSAEFKVKVKTEPLTADLRIEGELKLGGKITATVENVNYDYIPYEITWYRNGELVEGVKGNEYTVTVLDSDKDIKAKITAINGCEGEALSNVLHVGVFEISTDVYKINKESALISKINEQTTVDTFLSNLTFSNGVKAYKGDKELAGEDLITTGTEIRLYSGGEVVSTVTAVVTGDINGDGKISLIDFSNIKAYMLGDKEFTSFDKYAADANGDGKLSLIDFSQFKAHMLGDLTIEGKEY